MKILAIGDPHGILPKNLDRIMKKEKIDVIFCAGDVPPVPKAFRQGKINYFPKEFIKKADKLFEDIVKKLCSYGKPVLILRGNMYLHGDSIKLTKKIFSSHKNLIYKKTGKVKINGINFVLFDMSFEPHMRHAPKVSPWMQRQYDLNKPREKTLNKLLKNLNNVIIVSHAPPYGYLDKTIVGPRGSKILLRIIKKYKPKLVLCGHIHEAKGKTRIGKTDVYNLGFNGDYKILDV
jgi:uncharacterized protein